MRIEDAVAIQEKLRDQVDAVGPGPRTVHTVAGFDVAYDTATDRVAGAVVLLAAPDWQPIGHATAAGRAAFPYVPGLLSFRELPALLAAWAELPAGNPPDLLVCDGYGLVHPRRFGLACHLGVTLDLPTVGVAKTSFIGNYRRPGVQRGSWSPIVDGGDTVGRALRTQTGVKEVFVSVGHRIDLDTACQCILDLTPRHRLPETTRTADRLSRRALAAGRPADS
ncbi:MULTISPECIES: endonuclease V [unclassified Frankia]|uniref:endonuclease V n=1 Tax=unclassified Frankia TaxID=2632575 RepID=UPI002AD532C7|nr:MULTISPECIES: endonuclease V [unclassified Frankia]